LNAGGDFVSPPAFFFPDFSNPLNSQEFRVKNRAMTGAFDSAPMNLLRQSIKNEGPIFFTAKEQEIYPLFKFNASL